MGLADNCIEDFMHLARVGEDAFGTEGDTHDVGYLSQMMVMVVLEGEDIGTTG